MQDLHLKHSATALEVPQPGQHVIKQTLITDERTGGNNTQYSIPAAAKCDSMQLEWKIDHLFPMQGLQMEQNAMALDRPQAGLCPPKYTFIIDGRTGVIMPYNIPAGAHSSATGQLGSDRRPKQPGADAGSEDQLPLPEKPMSRRAVREIEGLIDSLPETSHSRQRRQPVPFTDDWHSSKPSFKKQRKSSDTAAKEPLLACHAAAPVKAISAPASSPAKHDSDAGGATLKPGRAGAAVGHDSKASVDIGQERKLSDRQARELEDLMTAQHGDCSQPRGRRPPSTILQAATALPR